MASGDARDRYNHIWRGTQMIDAARQAAALTQLIESGSDSSLGQPLAESVLRCCEGLLSAGEQDLALTLIQKSRDLASESSPDWLIRLEVQRARALRISG